MANSYSRFRTIQARCPDGPAAERQSALSGGALSGVGHHGLEHGLHRDRRSLRHELHCRRRGSDRRERPGVVRHDRAYWTPIANIVYSERHPVDRLRCRDDLRHGPHQQGNQRLDVRIADSQCRDADADHADERLGQRTAPRLIGGRYGNPLSTPGKPALSAAPAHAQQVERARPRRSKTATDAMAGNGQRWYGRPICLLDVPGSWITSDGDFVMLHVNGGFFASAMDVIESRLKRLLRKWVGRSTATLQRRFRLDFRRAASFFVWIRAAAPTSTRSARPASLPRPRPLWRVGLQPTAGSAGAATPGGTAHSSADTGALSFANPASGTTHLVGADVGASVIGNTLMIYDRLFSVAKTMNATTTEAVSGVPTRYQSTTSSAQDYIGDNFGFIEIGGTALAATAYNWTVCTYTGQDNASSTLPSVTGLSGGIVDRLDQPTNQWFVPLCLRRYWHEGMDADAVFCGGGDRRNQLLHRPSHRFHVLPGHQCPVAVRLADEP